MEANHTIQNEPHSGGLFYFKLCLCHERPYKWGNKLQLDENEL